MTTATKAMTENEFDATLADNARKHESTQQWDSEETRMLESKGTLGEMSVDLLSTNPANPRDGDWQNDVAAIVKDIRQFGFDKSQALTVHCQTGKDNGITLRGNRRLSAIKVIQAESIENGDLEFETLFPNGMVPVNLFEGLTKLEIATLTIDFGSDRKRKELNAYELFLAVKLLVQAGTLSRADIGRKLGQSKTWAQKPIALAKMPKYVQDAFKPVLLKQLSETKLRAMDIPFVYRDYVNTLKDHKTKKAGELAFSESVWSAYVDGTHPACQYAQRTTNDKADSVASIDYAKIQESANSFDSATLIDIINDADSADFVGAINTTMVSMEADLQAMAIAIIAGDVSPVLDVAKRYANQD